MRAIALALLLGAGSAFAQLPANQSIYNFDGGLNLSGSSVGTTATVSYYNGTDTSNAVNFNTTSGFGISNLAGDTSGTRTVMNFAAFNNGQALAVNPNVGPNGGSSAYVNNYTIGFDIYMPTASFNNWHSLWQTTTTPGGNDGDLWLNRSSTGGARLGVGLTGYSAGDVFSFDTWQRVVAVYNLSSTTDTVKYFIDGVEVLSYDGSQFDGRHALYSTANQNIAYIFGDNSNAGEMAEGYISSFYFSDFAMSDADVIALGGATASGFAPVPEPGSILAISAVGLAIPYLRRRRKNRQQA